MTGQLNDPWFMDINLCLNQSCYVILIIIKSYTVGEYEGE